MASIVETIVGDRRVSLQNEEFLRQFSWGNNWQAVRIVIRPTIVDTGANITMTYTIGVNSGVSDGYLSSNTVDFCGGRWTGSCSHNVGYYGLPGSSGNPIQKTGSTVNTVTAASHYGTYMAATDASGPGCFMMTMWRNIISTTMWSYPFSGNGLTSRYQALVTAEGGTPTCSESYSTTAIACGPFYDTVAISWSSTTPIEISDITVVRLY